MQQEIPRVLHRYSVRSFQVIWKYWMMMYDLWFSSSYRSKKSVILCRVNWPWDKVCQTWPCKIANVQIQA
jgi:hypothetical protein